MRYFKLENSDGKVLDITTEKLLFHDIEGLGFEEDNDFTPIGRVWTLNTSTHQQEPVTGSICFNEQSIDANYDAYRNFYAFIAKTPLVLLYYPNGLNSTEFRKRVRVQKLGKTENNEYGVLDCDIEFVPYTPWYKVVEDKIIPNPDSSGNSGWIWDRNNKWRELKLPSFSTYHYKFGNSVRRTLRLWTDIDGEGPVKLIIHGPLTNPSWTHYVNGRRKATGGLVEGSPVTIGANDILTIDNTNGIYSLTVYNTDTLVERNIYEYRDFNKQCFFTLKQGLNEIVINSDNNDPLTMEAEGHIYYATV